MPYRKRAQSEGDIYHVFARGTGRRIIFEDDEDRLEYRRRMESLQRSSQGELYAWCLMGNHVHLLAHMPLDAMAAFVKKLHGGYARFFNERHGRTGHLFEGRFGSEPITSDEQLLTAVRYIHRNPIEPGLSESCDYAWSSYREYLGEPRAVTRDFVLGMFGDADSFADFHEQEGTERFLDVRDSPRSSPCRMTHGEALECAVGLLGREEFEALPGLGQSVRNGHLRRLKSAGMSIRQIELVTGVGRGIVQNAVKGL